MVNAVTRKFCDRNLSSENFANISTECSSHHQDKSKEVWTNTAVNGNALLRIHIIGGQGLMWIAPPSLLPYHCSPASRDFQSSILVEALISKVSSGCAEPPSPAAPSLSWSNTNVSSHWIGNPHQPLTSNDVYPPSVVHSYSVPRQQSYTFEILQIL